MKCNVKNFAKELKKFSRLVKENNLEIVRSFIYNGSPVLEIKDTSVKNSKSVWLIDKTACYEVSMSLFSSIVFKDNKHNGLTHLAEHSLFHKIQLKDGRIMNANDIMNYGKQHNVTINAFTSAIGIEVEVSLTPEELKSEEWKDIMYNEYEYLKYTPNDDNIPIAIDMLESVTYRGSVDINETEKEKSVVSAEVSQRNGDNYIKMWRFLSDAFRTFYDFSGTPEDIQKYTYEDIAETINIFRRNVTAGCVTLDTRFVPAENIVRYVREVMDILKRNTVSVGIDGRRSKTKLTSHIADHCINGEPIPNKYIHKFDMRSDNSISDNPCVLIYWSTRDMKEFDTLYKAVIGSIFSNLMLNSMTSYFMSEFREKYGRCYNIANMNNPFMDKYINDVRHGFGLWYNIKPNEEDLIKSNNHYKVLNQIRTEIVDVMNRIFISKDDYEIGIKKIMDNKSQSLRTQTPTMTELSMHTLGLLDSKLANLVDKFNPKDISYEDFCKYLEYVKNNWTCEIIFK